MSAPVFIAQVRRLTNEPTQDPYSDEILSAWLDDAADDVYVVSRAIWIEKAARASTLVDVQEGSSRRALGDLQDHALAMVKTFDTGDLGVPEIFMRPGGTRAIERP